MTRRSLLRSTLLAGLLALMAAPAALAGAATDTIHESIRLVDDHGPGERYVIDLDAVFHTTLRPDGTYSVSMNARQVQTHEVDGVVVDVIDSSLHSHAIGVGEGEAVRMHSSGHHRYEGGGEVCLTSVVWQLIDGRVVVAHAETRCR